MCYVRQNIVGYKINNIICEPLKIDLKNCYDCRLLRSIAPATDRCNRNRQTDSHSREKRTDKRPMMHTFTVEEISFMSSQAFEFHKDSRIESFSFHI